MPFYRIQNLDIFQLPAGSVEFNNPFSLAILKDGKNKIGEKLYALSPLKNKNIPVEIVSSHYVDPKGRRVRS